MARKRIWTCAECGVRASFAAGAALSEPETWIEDSEGWHCLRCRREAAMAAVGQKLGGSLSAQRRRALLEFELLRAPSQSDMIIARRAACPTSRVAPVRSELLEAGRLPAG
jgi:hypothetical protein